ncbi:MAG TPA: CRISPR-associated endonuclease Cas2 [Campylobacterales bacterium]|nr:CRISPR-associated endonuclease Cas2 [Campylobacterales bacterium]
MRLFFEIIVTYDIEDNKNRKKLFEELKDMGLAPIQKSVFWGHLKVAEIKILPNLFDKYCKNGDKAFFVKAELSGEILKNGFGYTKEEFEVKEYDII